MIQPQNYVLFALSPLFALLCVGLWALFFSFFLPTSPTPRKLPISAFFLGIISMLAAFLVETAFALVLNEPDPRVALPVLTGSAYSPFVGSIISVVIIAAAVEEVIKFFVIRRILDSTDTKGIAAGIRIGLWVGLGFACIENVFYFFTFLQSLSSPSEIGVAFLIRGFLSTLAHGLYGIVMGYYLVLGRLHRLYRPFFFKTALIASTLIHAIFNFFLVTYRGYLSILFIAVILTLALVWYNERRDIEIKLPEKVRSGGRRPYFAHKYEIETVLSNQETPMDVFHKMLSWF